jgi:hypothetical protein
MPEPPVACLLTAPDLRERRSTVLAEFRAAQLEVRELADADSDGYAFRVSIGEGRLAALAELIELERQCCPFLRFQLTLEPSSTAVWLSLTGPAGTRDLLAHELGFVGRPEAR